MIKRTREEKLLLIAQQEESGQSVKEWCGEHQISAHTFYRWKRECVDGDTPSLWMEFSPVVRSSHVHAAETTIELNCAVIHTNEPITDVLKAVAAL